MEEVQQKRHWMLGSKSFLEYETLDYNLGLESLIKEAYLECTIAEPVIFKALLPRYWNGLLRPRWQEDRVNIYDPMITVSGDQVSFIMRDLHGSGFWELILTECMFKDFNGKKGTIFVDFNRDFVQQVQKLKSKSQGILRIDQTGFEYANDTEARFLPHENRDTLIKLLKQTLLEMNAVPDQELEIKTQDAWDQAITRKPLINDKFKSEYKSFFDASIGFDTRWGEVYNPFYRLTMMKTTSDKSRIAGYFAENMVIKRWEETNEYLMEIPLIDDLGMIRYQVEGRKSRSDRN